MSTLRSQGRSGSPSPASTSRGCRFRPRRRRRSIRADWPTRFSSRVPVTLIGLPASYSAANEWWARAGGATARTARATTKANRVLIFSSPDRESTVHHEGRGRSRTRLRRTMAGEPCPFLRRSKVAEEVGIDEARAKRATFAFNCAASAASTARSSPRNAVQAENATRRFGDVLGVLHQVVRRHGGPCCSGDSSTARTSRVARAKTSAVGRFLSQSVSCRPPRSLR